jgi:hypothetical protein
MNQPPDPNVLQVGPFRYGDPTPVWIPTANGGRLQWVKWPGRGGAHGFPSLYHRTYGGRNFWVAELGLPRLEYPNAPTARQALACWMWGMGNPDYGLRPVLASREPQRITFTLSRVTRYRYFKWLLGQWGLDGTPG